MLPLTLVSEGDHAFVIRIGGDEAARKHLTDLGFVPGTEVRIVSSPGNGNVIVKVRDAKLAITSEMAGKIMVEC